MNQKNTSELALQPILS